MAGAFGSPAGPVNVLICALGGEGGGVLAEWLYSAAKLAGHPAQATSVPGVAQRTGATTYYVEIGREPTVQLKAKGQALPVFCLNPVPGRVDLLVASELLEAVRQAGLGLVSPDRTQVIASTTRALTVAEKMQLTDGRVDSQRLALTLQAQAQTCSLLDLAALAQQAGTAVSAVLFGAMAASGKLPFGREPCEQAIAQAGKGVAPSLRGFALAFEAVGAQLAAQAMGQAPAPALAGSSAGLAASNSRALAHAPAAASAVRAELSPLALRRLAGKRLMHYQDSAYAQLYERRLASLEAACGPGAEGAAIVHEAARWLALWMAFDDVVHVASLKLATSRQARVHREVGAKGDDVVKVFDHFKPGVPELAGLLPPKLAQRLITWDNRRVAAGREPWAMPLALATHGVRGSFMLAVLSTFKRLRRYGLRYAQEQAAIGAWLQATERAAREHLPLAMALAQAGQLIKGYGATHARGRENLQHLLTHLAFAPGQDPSSRTLAVQAARKAAQADEAGQAFDATLRQHGAPARPVREQTVRWYKRRPAA